eukprot:3306933-Pleurochrysis_carterae.AAC.2
MLKLFYPRLLLKAGALFFRSSERGACTEWRVTTCGHQAVAPDARSTRSRCLAIHASRTHHHVSVMSPNGATACMHARLHAGDTRLRNLPAITADALVSLAHGHFDVCAACTEANATYHPHNTTHCKPSHAGRLIHADIAGPFVRTQHTGFQYLLILVDDHT